MIASKTLKQNMTRMLFVTALCASFSAHKTHASTSETKNLIASTTGCFFGGLVAYFAAPHMSSEFRNYFLAHAAATLTPYAISAGVKWTKPKDGFITSAIFSEAQSFVWALQMIAPLYSFLQFARKYAKSEPLTESDKSHLKNGIRQLIALYAAQACVHFGLTAGKTLSLLRNP